MSFTVSELSLDQMQEDLLNNAVELMGDVLLLEYLLGPHTVPLDEYCSLELKQVCVTRIHEYLCQHARKCDHISGLIFEHYAFPPEGGGRV